MIDRLIAPTPKRALSPDPRQAARAEADSGGGLEARVQAEGGRVGAEEGARGAEREQGAGGGHPEAHARRLQQKAQRVGAHEDLLSLQRTVTSNSEYL